MVPLSAVTLATFFMRMINFFAGILFLMPPAVSAHQEAASLEEVVITGRRDHLAGEARTASEGIIANMDLAIRPLLRPGDVLEAIPGLIVTQHSGSGKSNQMFLRGFNLDHGTDFATWLDGMPINMRSHGHGQGYTDLNFLIPETIEQMRFVKGPYHAELGDFSSAGGVHIDTFRSTPANQIALTSGANGFHRLLMMGGSFLGRVALSGAIEAQRYQGPWVDVNEDVHKLNGLIKLEGGDDDNQWQASALHYDNDWNSADQIPQRAVDQGLIGPLGSIDTTLGGKTQRSSLSGQYQAIRGEHLSRWNAYAIDYQLNLWSNFTYQLDNPVLGDQLEQVDTRRVLGGSYHHQWSPAANSVEHRWGAELRYDAIDTVGLYRTQMRQRVNGIREDTVKERSVGLFYEATWQFLPRWRAVMGARADQYQFDVRAEDSRNTGHETAHQISPKGSLIFNQSMATEWYLSVGRGFHSNDARGVTQHVDVLSGAPVDPVDPLVASVGSEIGLKTQWWGSWNIAASLWYLELDSELTFVGDAGTTEANRSSQRKGIELNNFWAINDIWSLEADFAWTDSQFSHRATEGNDIPGALGTVISTTLSAQLPSGWFGSLRVRYLGRAPLIENGTVQASSTVLSHLTAGWSGKRYALRADILNLLNSDDRDIEYYYASRLAGEPPEGIEDRHFHTFEPRQVRLTISLNL
jgi:hypothetical protein